MDNENTANGEDPLPPSGDGMYSEEIWNEIARRRGIPRRELQVGRLIFSGEKDAGIAHKLSLSPYTVRTYRRRFYDRFGVRTARDATIRICQIAQTLLSIVGILLVTEWKFVEPRQRALIPLQDVLNSRQHAADLGQTIVQKRHFASGPRQNALTPQAHAIGPQQNGIGSERLRLTPGHSATTPEQNALDS